jgi:H+-transporting ATPase
MVLTEPGLAGIVAAVNEGRVTFQRVLTYALNSITKKAVLFLAVGLIMTGQAIMTPLLMVIVMVTGDFLGMALTTDNVRPSRTPNAWQIGRLTIAGVATGIGQLVFCTSVLAFGAYRMGYDIDALRTLAFVVIVFANQATTYTNRERRRLWSSRPSGWLVVSSVVDITVASLLSIGGIAMTPLPLAVVGSGRLRRRPGCGEGAAVRPARHRLMQDRRPLLRRGTATSGALLHAENGFCA